MQDVSDIHHLNGYIKKGLNYVIINIYQLFYGCITEI